ncbi:MAG: hypothetical protein IH972_02195 [Candidatus Marinimicrobia bacterium]|nr:hypothetical protein [Candidatus Neomarinimicrobiota bacterium]
MSWAALITFSAAQEQEDVFLMDLGIVIEPVDSGGDSSASEMLTIIKAPAGAAYVESTRELRTVLDQLRSKIEVLEYSLDEDVQAVRLENMRLRHLIRKIQAERLEFEALPADADPPRPQPGDHAVETAVGPDPDYRDILMAYRAGQYDRVGSLGRRLDRASLDPTRRAQVAYWCADADFRTGAYDEALLALEDASITGSQLQDDVVILRGLIFMKQGRQGDALAQFQKIIDSYPHSDYFRLAEMTVKELHDL